MNRNSKLELEESFRSIYCSIQLIKNYRDTFDEVKFFCEGKIFPAIIRNRITTNFRSVEGLCVRVRKEFNLICNNFASLFNA